MIRVDPGDDDREETDEEYYHETSLVSLEEEKRRISRRRAESSTVMVPLSGVNLELNVAEEDRGVAITVQKCITSCGSVTHYSRQFEVLKKEETEP